MLNKVTKELPFHITVHRPGFHLGMTTMLSTLRSDLNSTVNWTSLHSVLLYGSR